MTDKNRLMISIPLEYKQRFQILAIKRQSTMARMIRDWIDNEERKERFKGQYDNGVSK